ncbi:uncharacterized protein DS421_5g164160 [Arachis hypogaea]|nr:uncharacterized protein DS421_5g164160 [Arachis hypogaea]
MHEHLLVVFLVNYLNEVSDFSLNLCFSQYTLSALRSVFCGRLLKIIKRTQKKQKQTVGRTERKGGKQRHGVPLLPTPMHAKQGSTSRNHTSSKVCHTLTHPYTSALPRLASLRRRTKHLTRPYTPALPHLASLRRCANHLTRPHTPRILPSKACQPPHMPHVRQLLHAMASHA